MSIAAEAPIGGHTASLWRRYASGDRRAVDALLNAHYDEFRRIARRVLNGDAVRLRIQPTDLAHEAAIRVMNARGDGPDGRTHFLALAAKVMRQTLIDEVRRARAKKREMPPVLTGWMDPKAPALDIEALDVALTRLEMVDAELATLVERRFFAGLSIEEIAAESKESASTVKRRWRVARAWLANELKSA